MITAVLYLAFALSAVRSSVVRQTDDNDLSNDLDCLFEARREEVLSALRKAYEEQRNEVEEIYPKHTLPPPSQEIFEELLKEMELEDNPAEKKMVLAERKDFNCRYMTNKTNCTRYLFSLSSDQLSHRMEMFVHHKDDSFSKSIGDFISISSLQSQRDLYLANKDTGGANWTRYMLPSSINSSIEDDTYIITLETYEEYVEEGIRETPFLFLTLENTLEIKTKRRRKDVENVNNSTRSSKCSGNSSCCLVQYEVRFHDVDWDGVHSPEKFLINYCAGSCGLDKSKMNYAYEEIMMNIINRLGPNDKTFGNCRLYLPELCKYKELGHISVFFTNADGSFSAKAVPNIQALSCECV
ncbi:growth/differentiation factor 8-like [Uloborus diversus]|uniref:growth/differentiation factor 8-like n=1 Tax=Uloborus diversus TaxID=327109 RepID=UPI00240A3417|nr:growth/differentiation factor 8-like [Uloborus diversus]